MTAVDAHRLTYHDAALMWFYAGWPGVLPANGGRVPQGYSGRKNFGRDPSRETVKRWMRNPHWAGADVGIRLPEDYVALDVDHYTDKGLAKHGHDTILDFEREHGELPPTMLTRTPRGNGNPSGIRWFRLPEGFEGTRFAGSLGPNVEIIQHGHRWCRVWPSVSGRTGRPYESLDQRTGEVRRGEWAVFGPDECALLPVELAEALPRAGASGHDLDYDEPVSFAAARQWVAEHGAGPMCRRMAAEARSQVAKLELSGDRHESALRASQAIVNLMVEGHRGGDEALATVRDAFLSEVALRPNGREDGDARAEWARECAGSVAKLRGAAVAPHAPGACPDRHDLLMGATAVRAALRPADPAGADYRRRFHALLRRARGGTS